MQIEMPEGLCQANNYHCCPPYFVTIYLTFYEHTIGFYCKVTVIYSLQVAIIGFRNKVLTLKVFH